jgi:tRNA 2-thiouridine synthesizing protein A
MEDASVLDLRGLKCPLPALMARRRLARLSPGAKLTVLADDPLAAVDIPHMCHEDGHDVIAVNKQDGHYAFEIRRSRAAGSGDPAGGKDPA